MLPGALFFWLCSFLSCLSHHSFHCVPSLSSSLPSLHPLCAHLGWAGWPHHAHCAARDKWKSSFNKAKCCHTENADEYYYYYYFALRVVKIYLNFRFVLSSAAYTSPLAAHTALHFLVFLCLRKMLKLVLCAQTHTHSRNKSKFKTIHFVSDNLNCFLFGFSRLCELKWSNKCKKDTEEKVAEGAEVGEMKSRKTPKKRSRHLFAGAHFGKASSLSWGKGASSL